MKRLSVAIAMIITVLLSTTVFGAENVFNITLDCNNVQKDGLFEVSVVGNSQSDVCAGEMVLSFDDSVAEFVEIKSDSFEVEAKENDGNLHIVFARSFPSESHSGIFKVVFKSLCYGSCHLSISCSESVDVNLEKLSTDGITTQIDVKSDGVNFSKEASNRSVDKNTKSFSNKADSDVKYIPTSTSDTIDIKNKRDIYIVILAVIGFCALIVIAFYLGVIFYKKTVLVDEDDDECDEDEYFY